MKAQSKRIDNDQEWYLKTFSVEPLGRLLVDWLHLPLSLIGAIFAFVYFGVLLILHFNSGHPIPSTVREIFQLPSTSFYYPNLIGITYDLIGNPLFVVILAFIRKDIPKQLTRLYDDNILNRKSSSGPIHWISGGLRNSGVFRFLLIVLLPITNSVTAAFLGFHANPPTDPPGTYAVFLTILGIYTSSTIFIQIVLAILILYSYSFHPKLLPNHPDQCSSLAPFGNLAIISYLFLFTRALFQSVAFSISPNLHGALNLWLFFPLLLIIIFDLLVYQPHKRLNDVQQAYLKKSNNDWLSYRESIISKLGPVLDSKGASGRREKEEFAQDLKILETWDKLNTPIVGMNTWPISISTFRVISVLSNPLIPLLLPIVVESVR